jgi:diguanylate cyclase (GGDEF)-like protein
VTRPAAAAQSLLMAFALLFAAPDGIAMDADNAPHRPLDLADQGGPNFQAFGAKDGLSEEIWSTVGFDADGFVWAGSASGLARFDGYRFQSYPMPQARSLVRDMESAPDGVLWAVFEREGLARYAQGQWQLTGQRGFAQRLAAQHGESGPQRLFLPQDAGALEWHQGHWQPLQAAEPALPGMTVKLATTQTLFGQRRIWNARTDGSLWFRDESAPGAAWKPFPIPGLRGAQHTDLLSTHDRGREELWVLSYGGGVLRINAKGQRLWSVGADALPSSAVYSAVATHDGDGARRLWLATRAGLVLIEGDRVRVFDRRHGLPSNAVRGLKLQHTADGGRVLWLATEGGIARARLEDSPWQIVSLIGSRENGIFGVLVEPDARGGERLWVGSAMKGLNLFAEGRWRRFEAADLGRESLSVRGIWRVPLPEGGHTRLLGLMGGELYRIDEQLRFERVPTPWSKSPSEAVTTAFARHHQGQLEWWVGLLHGGAWRWTDGQWQQLAAPEVGSTWPVLGIAGGAQGAGDDSVWLATGRGLARWREDALELVSPQLAGLEQVGFRHVAVLPIAGQMQLWASSSRAGVVRWQLHADGGLQRLTDDGVPEPPDPTVYSVLGDSRGRLYVCTNNGVQQLQPRAEGGFDSRVFRRRDGLVHDECNSNSQWLDAQDRYWVGSLGGLSVLDPRLQVGPRQRAPQPLRFLGAAAEGRMLRSDRRPVRVPPGQRELHVGYVLLAGEREAESSYRSRLEPIETQFSDWNYEPGRRFGALAPGDYRLHIEARDFSGVAAAPLMIELTVAPLWWQLRWVQMLAVVVGLLSALGLVWLYTRRLRKRERVLAAEVDRRTQELREANARLLELSSVDALTQLPNRRCLMESLDEVLLRARERQRAVGLILIDVDHFKDYNDRHGHLAGDSALRAVARALAGAKRESDLVARYGGEEFVCLMEDANPQAVAAVAERMRARVAGLAPREIGNDHEGLTLSAGYVVRVPAADETADQLLGAADAALYAAKRGGRNRALANEI